MSKQKASEKPGSGKSQNKKKLVSKKIPKQSDNRSDTQTTDLEAEIDALRAKNAEMQLEIEKQRRLDTPDQLSLILKHLSDAVIVSSHNGEVLLFNDSAEKMFGGWRPVSPGTS